MNSHTPFVAAHRAASRSRRASVALAPAALLMVFAHGPAQADDSVSIRTIAPSRSFVLVMADDIRGSVERFQRTPLFALWQSETVQRAVADDWKEFKDGLTDRLKELELPEDTLSWPVSGGLAGYLDRNEELDVLESTFMGVFDWGDGAEKMEAFFEANIKEIEKQSPDRVTRRDVRGRKAIIIDLPQQGGGSGPSPLGPNPMDELGAVERIAYVRDGARFVFASTFDGLEDALANIDSPPKNLVTDQEDARDALTQLGKGDVQILLRTGPLQPLVQEAGGGMMAMASPLLTQLFGDIQAYGGSLTFDGSIGQIDGAVSIFSPGGRKGLLSLLSTASPGAAPAVVPTDAIGYGRMNIAFADLMKVVDGTVASLPEMYAQEIEPMLQAYGPVLRSAFAALGPDLHVFTSVSTPADDDGQSNTIALACSDEQAVLPLINMFAPMVGMQSRDFLGQTIFTLDDFSVGFGGGFMLIGQTPKVEQALRSTAQGGGGPIQSPAEKAAMSLLPSRPLVGWGWFDTVAGFEVTRQALMASDGKSEVLDFVDERGRVVSEVVGVELPTKMIDTLRKMDPEFISQFVGPQLWDFAADNRGLVYRFSFLRPTKASSP
ncbi:MAG: hypothetical protein KF724_10600 [Phycisphaeraceae bacterium]|nr:hypothetical protein [Phycisphaeraceae bacterium]